MDARMSVLPGKICRSCALLAPSQEKFKYSLHLGKRAIQKMSAKEILGTCDINTHDLHRTTPRCLSNKVIQRTMSWELRRCILCGMQQAAQM